MKSDERLKWLKEEIQKLVTRYKAESGRYKKIAFRLKIVSVLLAALITIFLGLKIQRPYLATILSDASLVLGASITVLSAYEAFFDPRALWVRETVTFARLKDLQRDICFWEAGQDPQDINIDELNRFKSRLDQILEDTIKYWMKIRGAADLERSLDARADLSSQAVTANAGPSK
ncbi:MAG: SLATT domain-containing protein [Ginsengibacter sp.]